MNATDLIVVISVQLVGIRFSMYCWFEVSLLLMLKLMVLMVRVLMLMLVRLLCDADSG